MLKRELIKVWDKEAKSYRFGTGKQADFIANCFHLTDCLGNLKGKTILEVGSGSGQMSAYLASRGGVVHLLDVSTTALEYAKKYFISRNLKAKLFRQDAFNMSFAPASFDFVWNGGVIEHFDDSKKVLLIKNMWRLVKPGGKMVIMAPNAQDYPFMIAKKILQFRKKWAFGEEDDLTPARMEKLARKSGIHRFSIYAYNPVVGYWFFPFGREITDFLGLNIPSIHIKKTSFGHVVTLVAIK